MKSVSFLNLDYVLGLNLWWAKADEIISCKSDAHWDEIGQFSKVIIHWMPKYDSDCFENGGKKTLRIEKLGQKKSASSILVLELKYLYYYID